MLAKNDIKNISATTYQNSTNGILETEADAIIKGMDQTGSKIFTLNYNPTHGFLGDLLESGVDKFGGTTGIAKQTGGFIKDVTDARGKDGSNFANYSQGNELVKAGIEYQNEHGGFQDREYFVDENKQSQEEQKSGIPTFASFGSTVNTKDMENTIGSTDFEYSGAYTNDKDYVAQFLGGNKGQNEQMTRTEREEIILKIFNGDLDHSVYKCGDHKGAKCGDRP